MERWTSFQGPVFYCLFCFVWLCLAYLSWLGFQLWVFKHCSDYTLCHLVNRELIERESWSCFWLNWEKPWGIKYFLLSRTSIISRNSANIKLDWDFKNTNWLGASKREEVKKKYWTEICVNGTILSWRITHLSVLGICREKEYCLSLTITALEVPHIKELKASERPKGPERSDYYWENCKFLFWTWRNSGDERCF